MTRHPVSRRARVALAIGLCIGVFASGGTVTAAPEEVERCSTTVCAVAGVRLAINCSRPDPRTVECQGTATLWGQGRTNTATFPGALEWRGEGRCGGVCNNSQLSQSAAPWNGVTSQQGNTLKILVFPRVSRSSAGPICMHYSLSASSVSRARSLSPVRLGLDEAEAANTASIQTFACNQL